MALDNHVSVDFMLRSERYFLLPESWDSADKGDATQEELDVVGTQVGVRRFEESRPLSSRRNVRRQKWSV